MLVGYGIAFIIALFLVRDAYRLILFSNRGFDFTDEAFYALSYATKDQVGRSFTGATWLIGAFYDLLGHDLARLRVLKVAVLLFVGGLLGWQTFEWIYSHKRERIISTRKQLRGWKLSLILGSSLCALAPYSWTPATPSYNDLNLIILLLIGATSVSLLRARELSTLSRSVFLKFGMLGILLGAESFVKWSSAVTAFLLTVPIILYYCESVISLVKIGLNLFTGFIVFWLFTYIFLVDIFTVVPRSLSLLKIITQDGYDPKTLIHGYLTQITTSVKLIITDHKILFALCLVLPSIFKKFPRYIGAAASICLAIPIMMSTSRDTYIVGGPLATVAYGRLFVVAILAFSCALAIGHLIAHLLFSRSRGSLSTGTQQFAKSIFHFPTYIHTHPLLPVLWLLVLIPLVQATGTLNDIFTGATFSNVTWLLACVILATWFSTTLFVRYAIVLITLFGVWGIHHKVIDGFINKPYRLLASPARLHTPVKGLPRIEELRFDNSTAKYLSQLRDLRNRAHIKEGATMIGVWNVPGEIYALGGISPGEPWYIGVSTKRNIENVKYSCKTGQIDKKDPPIILLSMEPPLEFLDALSDCGINFPEDYRKVGSAKSPYTLLETDLYSPKRK